MKELIIENLRKSYSDVPVFEGVNLHYRSGLLNGIIGKNGAGKSTFFNCIARIIAYEGNIARKNIESIGTLSANQYIFPRITGYEFVRFCLSAKKRPENKQRLLQLNELFELPLKKYAENYSTGMLKKLHLLALLLQENDLLMLDEPFNGLDIQSAAYLSEILKEMKHTNSLIFISSHDISHLLKIVDTLTVIENGSVYLKTESLSDIEKTYQKEAEERVKSVFIKQID
ncbi:MAG: ATP-binding cassette domain-containing protein [Bacteroidia bacterium]|nr:ATP-binding cassette domain-containing protein [Bacteroidia bacterium]